MAKAILSFSGFRMKTKDEQLIKDDVAPTCGSFMRTNSEGEPVLRFYWLDAFEDPVKIPGVLYLFSDPWVAYSQ